MKIFILIAFLIGINLIATAQITFNGAHPLFDNQDFTFNFESTDATGRNVYTTSPIDGNQPCGGVGICELKLTWNDTDSQWEMLADDGNGGFISTFLVFKNTEESTPNPPSLTLGVWEENTDLLSSGDAGGDLTTTNTTLTGNVQDFILNISKEDIKKSIVIYPNPVTNKLNLETNLIIREIEVYDITGKLVLNKLNYKLKEINVSKLNKGLYFLDIHFEDYKITKKIMVE